MSELVVILKGGNKRNVKGAVLADKAAPPFTERRDGYRLRWWGADHPASMRIRALVEKAEEYTNGLCPFMAECYKTLGLVKQHCSWNLDDPRTWQFCGGYRRRKKGMV